MKSVECTIRMIEDGDVERILQIYEPYILNPPVTFEYTVPSVEDFTDRVPKIQIQYPWLVCEVDGEIAGYVYAGPYRSQMAFSWDAKLSVYLDPKFQGLHIGVFFIKVDGIIKGARVYNLYALISLPKNKEFALRTLAPPAVACDIFLLRRSVHPPPGGFLLYRTQFPIK